MKRLFKLGLVALMGICGLVGISNAQIAVTVDTAASESAGCTLNAETGVWSTPGSDNFGLKLKVLNPADGRQYSVAFTCKDAEGNNAFEEEEGSSTLTGFGFSECAALSSGTYTMVFTLRDKAQGSTDDPVAVDGVATLTIQISVVTPALKLTSNPAYTEIDDEKTNMVGQAIQFKRWIFPSNTKPVFTIEIENGDIAECGGFMVSVTPEGEEMPIYYAQLMVEEDATSVTFTLQPMDLSSEEEDISAQADVPEFMPDGKYEMSIVDGSEVFMESYFLGFGSFPIYGMEAVGATTETMEGEEYKKFATDEAVFAVKAENAPADWFAVVTVITGDRTFVDADTLRTQDSIATFTTLTGGEFYYVYCKVYNVKGTNVGDTVMVWSNGDGFMSLGVPFQITGEILPTDPTFTVAAASNGTPDADGKITFNGMATFTTAVSNFGENDSAGNYDIVVRLYTNGDYPPAESEYAGNATVVEFVEAYNGNYEVDFILRRKAQGEQQAVAEELAGTLKELSFTVTNYEAPAELEISAKAVGATVENEKITFGKDNIAFDIFVENRAAGDTSKIDVYIWTAEEAENGAGADAIRINAADSVRFAAEGIYYDGEYVAKFDLRTYNARRGEEISADVFEIPFFVTGNPVPEIPEMTVKAVNNTVVEDTVVFADGNVAFDMFVKDLTAKDTNIELRVSVWNTADEADYPLSQIFKAADSVRFEGLYYNGKYAATFEIGYINGREFIPGNDTTIIFLVTENEEIIDNYTVAIKPVGATMTGDKAAYTGNVVFDILVGGLKADDDMNLVTTIFTPAEYADTIAIEPKSTVKAADSVRFETSMSNGEYVALVELVRAGNREDMVVEFATLNLTVGGAAIEYSELAGVNVYPNPSNGTFNVAVPEKARIDIFGLNGAKVMSREANAGVETFSINHSGIYFVRVMAGNKAAVKRVVVR